MKLFRTILTSLATVALATTPATVPASSFGASSPAIPYVSGRYHAFDGPGSVATGSAAAAGTLRCTPYMVHRPVTAASLVVRVTTAAASGNFQLIFYDSAAATNDPTGAPLYTSASQTTASAATVEVTGVNLSLLANHVYWGCLQVDTNGATAAFTTVGTTDPYFTRLIGLAAGTNTPITSQSTSITKTGTFGSPPTLTGNRVTDSFTDTNGVGPYITFKAA